MSGRSPVQLNQLNSTIGALTMADLLGVFKQSQGTTVFSPMTLFLQLMQDNLDFDAAQFSTAYKVQNEVPLTGETIVANAGTSGTENVYLVLQPAGTLTDLTVTLPVNTTAIDGQSVVIASSKAITDFNVLGNGASVVGRFLDDAFVITAILNFQYNKASETWFLIS